MIRHVKDNIPNTLTCLNLACGALACIFAFSAREQFGAFTGEQIVWMLIGAAAFFDFFDGACARLLGAHSLIGKELDSLSDLISFGMAPAMLLYNVVSMEQGMTWLAFLTIVIPIFGALRLAKFNVDDSQTTVFRGLPIPSNAIFWIGATAWIEQYGLPADWILAVVVVAMSLMMVTRLPMFSLKFKNFKFGDNFWRYFIVVATVAFLAIFGVIGLAYTILLYILISALQKAMPN